MKPLRHKGFMVFNNNVYVIYNRNKKSLLRPPASPHLSGLKQDLRDGLFAIRT